MHSYELKAEKTDLKLNIQKVELALDQAVPCGLILNELITNSLKYAYRDDENGVIEISVQEVGKKEHISVKDYGVVLPENFNGEFLEALPRG